MNNKLNNWTDQDSYDHHLFVEGRGSELISARELGGEPTLTADGIVNFEKLMSSGFRPRRAIVRIILERYHGVQADELETLTDVIMGHARKKVRKEFLRWVSSHEGQLMPHYDTGPVAALLVKLEHCQDVVPKRYCKLLAIDPGSTYSDAVAWLRFRDARQQVRGEECVYPHRDEEDECDEEEEA